MAAKRRRTARMSAWSGARAAANVRYSGLAALEQKFVDIQLNALTIPVTVAGGELDHGTTLCLNAMAQGDTESERVGRRIIMKSIHIDGAVYFQNDTSVEGPDAETVRLSLVLDTQTNQQQLDAEDVYVEPAAGSLAAFGARNLAHTGRFKVLWTKTFTFSSTAGAGSGTTSNDWGGGIRHFRIDKKLNIPVHFEGTGGTVANIADNSLHLIGVCSPTGGTGNTMSAYCRLRYTD